MKFAYNYSLLLGIETPSNVHMELYIGMATTLLVVGSIAIVTGFIACVLWRRRTQSSSKEDHTYIMLLLLCTE